MNIEKSNRLCFAYGGDSEGNTIVGDLNVISNMLVVGDDGHVKKSLIDNIITSLTLRNTIDQFKFAVVNSDFKAKEIFDRHNKSLYLYKHISHSKSGRSMLFKKLYNEMNNRYLMLEQSGVLTIKEYNDVAIGKNINKMPEIIVFVNDYKGKIFLSFSNHYYLIVLAQKARAVGIHLIFLIDSKTKHLITPAIKNNTSVYIEISQDGNEVNRSALYVSESTNTHGKHRVKKLGPIYWNAGFNNYNYK